KGIGMLLFERLQYLKRQAVMFTEVDAPALEKALSLIDTAENVMFTELSLLEADGIATALQNALDQPGTVWLQFSGNHPAHSVWLYLRNPDPEIKTITAVRISDAYLWDGLDEYDAAYNFLVRDDSGQLLYSDAQESGATDAASNDPLQHASWNLLAV